MIPFGIIGALLGHLLLGNDLSILSVIGIVGVVANDSPRRMIFTPSVINSFVGTMGFEAKSGAL